MPELERSRIAVPLAGGRVSAHYGQSSHFAVFDVDVAAGAICGRSVLEAPGEHVCGMSGWLREQGVGAMIVAGIGQGALAHLAAAGITVWGGDAQEDAESLVLAAMAQKLMTSPQSCRHAHDEGCHGHGRRHHHHDHHHGHHHGPCDRERRPETP